MVQQPVVDVTGLGLQLVEVDQPPAAAQVPGVVDDGLDAQRSPLLEVLLHPAMPVEGVDGHVNTAGDDPGSEDAGRRRQDPPAEDQFDLVRPTHIQVVGDQRVEEQPAVGGPVEHQRAGDLDLAHRQVPPVAGLAVRRGQRQR